MFWSSGQGSELQIPRSWVQTPLGENMNFYFLIFYVFLTKIVIFYALMHNEIHKWSLFYFMKIYNNCSFSFSSKMKFSVSQLDVVEMKNWKHVPNVHEKTVIEMLSDLLEHFFSALFILKSDMLYSKFPLKSHFSAWMSFDFFDILDLCWKFLARFIALFKTYGALILGLTQFWSTVKTID